MTTAVPMQLPGYCAHCGMLHAGPCPRIKVIEYHPNGTVKRVEYHETKVAPLAEPLKAFAGLPSHLQARTAGT